MDKNEAIKYLKEFGKSLGYSFDEYFLSNENLKKEVCSN